jgi:hypothetical protein
MSTSAPTHTCLNCGHSENERPLVALRYQQQSNWICSQCLPILIHKPIQLVGRLQNAAQIPPAEHD